MAGFRGTPPVGPGSELQLTSDGRAVSHEEVFAELEPLAGAGPRVAPAGEVGEGLQHSNLYAVAEQLAGGVRRLACQVSSLGKSWSSAKAVCPRPEHAGSRVRFDGQYGIREAQAPTTIFLLDGRRVETLVTTSRLLATKSN